jgi:hypothetical protein
MYGNVVKLVLLLNAYILFCSLLLQPNVFGQYIADRLTWHNNCTYEIWYLFSAINGYSAYISVLKSYRGSKWDIQRT